MKTKKIKTRKPATTTSGMKGGVASMAIPAAGAVAGAVIGGVAAFALADEKKRKAISDTVTNVADYAVNAIDTVNEDMMAAQETMHDTAEKTLEATSTEKKN